MIKPPLLMVRGRVVKTIPDRGEEVVLEVFSKMVQHHNDSGLREWLREMFGCEENEDVEIDAIVE